MVEAKTLQHWLGAECKDVITGIEGICSSVLLQSNGNLMLAVQPRAKENVAVDPVYFDIQCVDRIGDGITSRVPVVVIDDRVSIGDKVKDTVSAFTGTITASAWFANGCVQHTVTTEQLNRDNRVIQDYFMANRLEKIAENKAVKDIPPTKTGGPAQRVHRAR